MVLQSLCWGGLCIAYWKFQSSEQQCWGFGYAKEPCEGLLQSENEEFLIWRGGKHDETANWVRTNVWETVKTRRGRGGGAKKEKREKEVCANFVPQIVKVTTFRWVWQWTPAIPARRLRNLLRTVSATQWDPASRKTKTKQKWAWWHMSIITALGQWRQEDQEFKARKLRPAKSVWDSASKRNKLLNET